MLRVVYLIYTLLICQSFAFVRMSRTVKRVAPAFDEVTEDVLGQSPGQLPGVSSRLNFCKAAVNLKYDWWIVGTGTLGVEILKQLRIPETGISVIAETHEEAREKVISDLGATHMLRKDRLESDHETARNVVICIPPSAANYTEEVHAATMLWAGPASGGSLIYTSSIGVYGESHGNTVDEEFRVDTRSASATK